MILSKSYYFGLRFTLNLFAFVPRNKDSFCFEYEILSDINELLFDIPNFAWYFQIYIYISKNILFRFIETKMAIDGFFVEVDLTKKQWIVFIVFIRLFL